MRRMSSLTVPSFPAPQEPSATAAPPSAVTTSGLAADDPASAWHAESAAALLELLAGALQLRFGSSPAAEPPAATSSDSSSQSCALLGSLDTGSSSVELDFELGPELSFSLPPLAVPRAVDAAAELDGEVEEDEDDRISVASLNIWVKGGSGAATTPKRCVRGPSGRAARALKTDNPPHGPRRACLPTPARDGLAAELKACTLTPRCPDPPSRTGCWLRPWAARRAARPRPLPSASRRAPQPPRMAPPVAHPATAACRGGACRAGCAREQGKGAAGRRTGPCTPRRSTAVSGGPLPEGPAGGRSRVGVLTDGRGAE